MSNAVIEKISASILVVDDNSANLQLLCSVLNAEGYTVYPASDGDLALEFVDHTLPDLILLDIRMPGMDGFEVCRRLKANQKTSDVPIIFISILEDEHDKVEAFRQGAVDYITKPIQAEVVLARVAIHLRSRELTERLEQLVDERTSALRASEEQYRLIVEQSQQGIWVLDKDSLTTFINPRLSEMFGYSSEDMQGRPATDFLYEEDVADFQSMIEKWHSGSKSENYERRYRHKDGHPIWTLLSVTPRFDELQNYAGTFAMLTDICKRKRTTDLTQARLRILETANPLDFSLDDTLVMILDEIEMLTGSDIGFYHFMEEDQQTISLQNWSTNTLSAMCTAGGKGRHYPVAEAGVWADCVRERRPVIHNDYASLANRHGLPDGHAPVVRELVVPIFRGGRITAIVGVGNKQAPYDDIDLEIVSQLADLSWEIVKRKIVEKERQGHLRFLAGMDRINRAIQGTNDLEQMMSDVLDTVLDILDCDRAFLMYPADPDAPTWTCPMERTKPEYPGVMELGLEMPMDGQVAETIRALLAAKGPIACGPGSENPLPTDVAEQFGFKCYLAIAIFPRTGKPWQFGIHQCSHARIWTKEEERLLKEIGRRLEDALSTLLTYRNLQHSEKRFNTLVNQAADAFFVHNLDGRFLEVNQAACKSLGYTKEELLDMNVSDVDAEFISHNHVKNFWSKMKPDHPVAFEGRHRRKDGTTFPVEVHLGLLKLENSQACLALVRDITNRKLAEQTLHEQKVFLQNSLDSLTHPFYIINVEDYTIALANMASRFVGHKEGTTCYELTHNRSKPCRGHDCPCPMQEVLSKREPVVLEHIHCDENGTEQYTEVHAYPVFNDEGKIVQIIEYCIDISARKKDEKERLRFTAVIEQTADSIVITDQQATIQYVNPSFEKTTGYSSTEVIGKNPRFLQSGHQNKRFYHDMWDTLVKGKVWRGKLVNKKKDGSLYDEEASITPVLDDSGKILNYVAVKRDITEQIKLEKQLQQAQKMESIGTLAGGIAHDFNNILTAIIGFAELAKYEMDNAEDFRQDLDQIFQAGLRAKELVKQILTFSRCDDHTLQPLKIQLVIQEALKLLRSSIPSTIAIKANINADCEAILANPTQIHQVIMNLCTNAYHAMRETGGILAVSLQPVQLADDNTDNQINLPAGPYLKLEISDTGHGMSPNVQNKIFEPYYTTKVKGEGTGLGLAVVHGIIGRLHGDISVYSKKNEGSTFRIYLPVVASYTYPKDSQKEAPAPLPTGNERILLVDDVAVVAQMMKGLLESLGYQVSAFTDSLNALKKFQQEPEYYDLIITDMTMPNMTGAKLAEQILTIRPHMKIILCTGYSELINAEKAKALGICDYIMKPVTRNDFAYSVRKVLDGSL